MVFRLLIIIFNKIAVKILKGGKIKNLRLNKTRLRKIKTFKTDLRLYIALTLIVKN
jgi:hypothetical protein